MDERPSRSTIIWVVVLGAVALSGCMAPSEPVTPDPGYERSQRQVDAFLVDVPGHGESAQLTIGVNGWVMFNWTRPAQDLGPVWWAVVDAPDPQNVSLAVVVFSADEGLEVTGRMLSTPLFFTTDPDEGPEFAARAPHSGAMQSLRFERDPGAAPTVLVAVDTRVQQDVQVTLVPGRTAPVQGDVPDDLRAALDGIDASDVERIPGAAAGPGVSLQRFQESWTASNGAITMHREWWPEGVSQQPAAAAVPDPATYATTSVRMGYAGSGGFALFNATVVPDPGVATSVVGRGTVLGHSLETSRGHVGGGTCVEAECNGPFLAYTAVVEDVGGGLTNYALDVGFKGAVTDRMDVESQLVFVAADVEGFTGQPYPSVVGDEYHELV